MKVKARCLLLPVLYELHLILKISKTIKMRLYPRSNLEGHARPLSFLLKILVSIKVLAQFLPQFIFTH